MQKSVDPSLHSQNGQLSSGTPAQSTISPGRGQRRGSLACTGSTQSNESSVASATQCSTPASASSAAAETTERAGTESRTLSRAARRDSKEIHAVRSPQRLNRVDHGHNSCAGPKLTRAARRDSKELHSSRSSSRSPSRQRSRLIATKSSPSPSSSAYRGRLSKAARRDSKELHRVRHTPTSTPATSPRQTPPTSCDKSAYEPRREAEYAARAACRKRTSKRVVRKTQMLRKQRRAVRRAAVRFQRQRDETPRNFTPCAVQVWDQASGHRPGQMMTKMHSQVVNNGNLL